MKVSTTCISRYAAICAHTALGSPPRGADDDYNPDHDYWGPGFDFPDDYPDDFSDRADDRLSPVPPLYSGNLLSSSPEHSRPASPSLDDDNEPDLDLAGDPLHADLEDLFSEDDLHGAGVNDDLDDETGLPPAFSEDPVLRNIYVNVALARARGATHAACAEMLASHRCTLEALSRRTITIDGVPHKAITIDGLDTMAGTVRTVERRLGIDPDQHIVYNFVCTVCWALHSPNDLYKLDEPGCDKPDCSGKLYRLKTLTDGTVKRIPLKIVPMVPLIPAIERVLLRPGKIEELNAWRKLPGDEAGLRIPPETFEDWPGFANGSHRLSDITDGWAWRAIAAGLERRRSPTSKWGFEDVDVSNVNQRFVNLPNGLVLMMNIDW